MLSVYWAALSSNSSREDGGLRPRPGHHNVRHAGGKAGRLFQVFPLGEGHRQGAHIAIPGCRGIHHLYRAVRGDAGLCSILSQQVGTRPAQGDQHVFHSTGLQGKGVLPQAGRVMGPASQDGQLCLIGLDEVQALQQFLWQAGHRGCGVQNDLFPQAGRLFAAYTTVSRGISSWKTT